MFGDDWSKFAPDACQYWQSNRIPRSPLYPYSTFQRWLHTDSEENYHRRGNKTFSVESVGYEFNKLGYRGADFDRKPGEALVMFVGDSNTVGLGMPWDGLWTSLVTKRLEERWAMPVRQCNLGWGATGSDYVAMMVHQCVEVLKPAAVFVLWSFASRITWFANPRRQVFFLPEWQPAVDTQEHGAYMRLATPAQGFFNYVRNFHFVRERLARLGITYGWGHLEPFTSQTLAPYLPLDGYAGRLETLDLARDGRHAGLKSHAAFAERVVAAMDGNRPVEPAVPAMTISPSAVAPAALARRDRRAAGGAALAAWVRAMAPRRLRDLFDQLRARGRARALKRRDPFIY